MNEDRLGQVQELVARTGGCLIAGARRIQEGAEMLDLVPDIDDETKTATRTKLETEANDLLALRRALLDLLELSLPDDVVVQLKGAFTSVGINDAKDRRDLAEMVADRPILALADLTQEEAGRLLREIKTHEEPF